MRSSVPRSVLSSFLRRLPLAALAAGLLWAVARPVYTPALCAVAQWAARVYEYPKVAQIEADGDRVILGRSDLRSDSGRQEMSATQLTFNLIPFLALVFAMPRPFSKRGWRRLLEGVGILAAVHVAGLIIHLKFFYAFSLGPWSTANYSDFARNVIGGLRIFVDIPITFALPLVLWVALFPDRVFPLLGLDDQLPRS